MRKRSPSSTLSLFAVLNDVQTADARWSRVAKTD